MKKVFAYLFLCSLIFANDTSLNILQKDKKLYQELEKKAMESRYQNLKNSWIGGVGFDSSLSYGHPFSTMQDSFSKAASISFRQSIFESGGIELQIEYAKDRLKYDNLVWESKNQQYLQNIYIILLNINQLNLQIEQSRYKGLNKEVEEVIKKVRYEAGKGDIVELNDAIMNKNLIKKEIISLEHSLHEQEIELEKYTPLKYNQIELVELSNISKDNYLQNNLDILQEESKATMLYREYEKTKTSYLPKIYFSTGLNYSNSDNTFSKSMEDTKSDYTSFGASLGLEMPLYDYTKSTKLQESKLEALKQKALVDDKKNEELHNFDEMLSRVDTLKKHIKTIEENIALYDELIEANEVSFKSGMTSQYDLEVLKNTQEINRYDILINNISILKEYAQLYFKIRG